MRYFSKVKALHEPMRRSVSQFERWHFLPISEHEKTLASLDLKFSACDPSIPEISCKAGNEKALLPKPCIIALFGYENTKRVSMTRGITSCDRNKCEVYGWSHVICLSDMAVPCEVVKNNTVYSRLMNFNAVKLSCSEEQVWFCQLFQVTHVSNAS